MFLETLVNTITFNINLCKMMKIKRCLGQIFKDLRKEKNFKSLNIFALENGINRANLSKIENGEVGCSIITAWRISEALGLKLSDVIKILENELGDDFKLIEE